MNFKAKHYDITRYIIHKTRHKLIQINVGISNVNKQTCSRTVTLMFSISLCLRNHPVISMKITAAIRSSVFGLMAARGLPDGCRLSKLGGPNRIGMDSQTQMAPG